MQNDPEFDAAVKEMSIDALDFVESQLLKAIAKGNMITPHKRFNLIIGRDDD